MPEESVHVVRNAYEALRRGDLEAVAALIDPEIYWQGAGQAPEGQDERDWDCRDRDEALEVLRWRLECGEIGKIEEMVSVGDAVLLCSSLPAGMEVTADGQTPARIFQVVKVRDGKIVRVEDHLTRDDALAATR